MSRRFHLGMGLIYISFGIILGALLESWLIAVIWVVAGLVHIYTVLTRREGASQ